MAQVEKSNYNISANKTSAKAQQLLTVKYKHATNELRISQLAEGQWFELTAVIKKSALRIKNNELVVQSKNDSYDINLEKAAPITPRTPRSVTEVTVLSPLVCVTQESKKKTAYPNPNPMDYMTRFHQLCTTSSTSLDMFRIVLSTNPALAKRKNKDHDLPLHVALTTQDDISAFMIIELLQAYPESASIRNGSGLLPLFLACKKPKVHSSIIKSILNCNTKATTQKPYGSTPLHLLTYTGSGHVDAIKYILAVDSSLAAQTNNFGNLPLHYQVMNNSASASAESIHSLVNAYPAGVRQKNKSGESPLHRLISKWRASLASNESSVVVQGLRYMLRSLVSSSMNEDEKNIYRQLNWQSRKEILLAMKYGNLTDDECTYAVKTGQSDTTYDSDLAEDYKPPSDSCSLREENQVATIKFAYLLKRMHCDEIRSLIFSYI